MKFSKAETAAICAAVMKKGRSLNNKRNKMNTQHTPTPWTLEAIKDGDEISSFSIQMGGVEIASVSNMDAEPVNADNAALIVKAVNSHGALLDALRLADSCFRAMECSEAYKKPDNNTGRVIRAALALASEQP